MDVLAVLSQLGFDVAEAIAESPASLTQSRLGIKVEMAGQTGQGEEQVAKFVFLAFRVLSWQRRR
jgi:hypothetical protein